MSPKIPKLVNAKIIQWDVSNSISVEIPFHELYNS